MIDPQIKLLNLEIKYPHLINSISIVYKFLKEQQQVSYWIGYFDHKCPDFMSIGHIFNYMLTKSTINLSPKDFEDLNVKFIWGTNESPSNKIFYKSILQI